MNHYNTSQRSEIDNLLLSWTLTSPDRQTDFKPLVTSTLTEKKELVVSCGSSTPSSLSESSGREDKDEEFVNSRAFMRSISMTPSAC
jgi:hypothetical protein